MTAFIKLRSIKYDVSPIKITFTMRLQIGSKRTVIKYALFGIFFGLCFPIIALTFSIYHDTEIQVEDFGLFYSIIAIHYTEPLNLIIDTAPLILGIVFGTVGVKQARIDYHNHNLENLVTEKTQELKASNSNLIEKTKIIEKLYKNLADNVRYAKRIQSNILYSDLSFVDEIQDHFIVNKPRDFISGDFYWGVKTSQDNVLIAVGDCTGHGVTAGILTIIARDTLQEIITENENCTPAEILKYLDQNFNKKLYPNPEEQQESLVYDGIDIAIVKINYKTNKIIFSGAKSKMYLINDQGDMKKYKGSIYSIGQQKHTSKFTNTEVVFQKNDTIYMGSDGYPDQFDKNNKKKISRRNFERVLNEIANRDMSNQKEYLETFLEEWKGEVKQTDDILVMGVKV